jgi:hypothetical protein
MKSVFYSFLKFFYAKDYFLENFFFIRVDRRVIGVEELESDVSFLKFFSNQFFYTKNNFCTKKFFFVRIERRVIGVEGFKSGFCFFVKHDLKGVLKFIRLKTYTLPTPHSPQT